MSSKSQSPGGKLLRWLIRRTPSQTTPTPASSAKSSWASQPGWTQSEPSVWALVCPPAGALLALHDGHELTDTQLAELVEWGSLTTWTAEQWTTPSEPDRNRYGDLTHGTVDESDPPAADGDGPEGAGYSESSEWDAEDAERSALEFPDDAEPGAFDHGSEPAD